MRRFFSVACVAACVSITIASVTQVAAQSESNAEPLKVVIKRDAITVLSADQFRNPISLQPVKSLEIRAQVSGVIQNVRIAPGAKVSAQEELIRIDSAQATKLLERAQAVLEAAKLRRDSAAANTSAGAKTGVELKLAEAEITVAQADLELAQLQLENTSVRAPFAGQVTVLSAIADAAVSEGDLLLILRDDKELTAQIPINRDTVKVGDQIDIQLDSGQATGKVQSVMPLNEQWQKLRQIVDTAALAVVTIDNKTGRFSDGQTVYSPIVPRQPVIEAANTAIQNSESGSRVVQVLRDNMIRDIDVTLLGPIGADRSYVSGPFQPDDELIAEISQPLPDGTIVQTSNPVLPESTSDRTPEKPAGNRPAPSGNPGF